MKLPNMKYADRITKKKQVDFGGLNLTAGAGDGELRDMRNLTSDHYPLLATRAARLKYHDLDKPGGVFSWDGLCWVEDGKFYFRGEQKGTVSAGIKTFASMGAYIIILPDKCYYNVDTDAFGSMEAKWNGTYLVFRDGKLYGEDAKANAIQAAGVNWADYFKQGDAVTISGCVTHPGNNKTVVIREIDGDKLYFYENTFTIPEKEMEEGYGYAENTQMKVERTVPDLKHMCQNENRLWGCTDTTIYASKLGDIFNWNVYDGLDTDAYAVDTGSAGAFTGCISYGGYPTFFKEDHIYKVYGSVPSNFEVLGSATLGLAEGCSDSLAIAGETLFYLGRNGIMAYTGGIPQPMGAVFGTKRFRSAVGGSDGLKYYVSMQDDVGVWGLYVYDTQTGLWHKEDEVHITHFTRWAGNLYLLTEAGELWIAGNANDPPADTTAEGRIEWFAEFSDFTEDDPNKKGLSKIQIRLELDNGAEVKVFVMYDSDGEWVQAGHAIGESIKRSYYLPVIPRRSDHYRLKLTGTGGCRVHSLVRETYSGSELRSKAGRN